MKTKKNRIKLTAELSTVFAEYGVTVRNSDTTITHATYGTQHRITPLNFAVYELAIKSVWAGHLASGKENERAASWYKQLATCASFELVENFKSSDEHAADYYIASNLLGRAGLYYDLLD